MVDDAFGNWLAGFVAGEGTFSFLIRRTVGTKYKFRPRFEISQRNDNMPILFEIAQALGCGHVYTEQKRGGKRVNRNPMAAYICDDIESLYKVVVPLFESYPLRARKVREFAIWKEAIALMFRITRRRKVNTRWGWFPRYTKEEKLQLKHYAELLKEARSYQGREPPMPEVVREPQLSLIGKGG